MADEDRNNDAGEHLDYEDDPAQESEVEEESDDEYYDDPVDVIKDFGNHPLMERAQKALVEQLQEAKTRVDSELYDKEEELKRISQSREALGVELYNLQQQLAKLQVSLENTHGEYNNIIDKKLQEEEMNKAIESNNKEQAARVSEHEKSKKKYQGEYESLVETLRQIEAYNEEVKTEIAITRRATHKAEQSMQSLEQHKAMQDLYVDRLSKQVKQLQEQIALYGGQIEAQRGETKEAHGVFQETVDELELIAQEKRQLMTQWKAALSGLSRRDEALAQASLTLKNAESAVHDYDVELETNKRNIQMMQGKHENLVYMKDRLESELQWVEENLVKIRQEREAMQERFALLTKSLAQTDGEMKKLEGLSKSLLADAESLLQNLQIVTRERQRMEEEMQGSKSTHSNVNKAVANLAKKKLKVMKTIHDREIEGINVDNEISRTNLDKLNCNMQNDQLRDTLKTNTKEFQEKEALIDKYQVEIRQRHDEIEKKMYRVDRLNKKYDKMVESAGGEENLGPLEYTIKNLEREIDALSTECKDLERDWLKRQTEMVAVTSEGDEIAEANFELQARVTILSQQQLRVMKELRSLKGEVKTAEHGNIALQKDVAKLNVLISQNQDQEGFLQDENYVLEMSCVEELKAMEAQSVQLQASVNETKSSKAQLQDEIMDTERQALLWEKKIQLDKETRAALDPSVGQAETLSMEREIHRMGLRLEALKREQERLSVEMARAITKRSSIATRFKAPKPADGGGGTKSLASTTKKKTAKLELTQATMQKQIGVLKKDSKALANETSQYTGAIEERKAQFSEMTSELERVTTQYGQVEDSNRQLQTEINDLLYQKQLNQERVSYKQKYVKRLKDYSAAGIDNSLSLQTQRRLLASSQALDNVKEIISDLQSQNPHLTEVLGRVMAMTDPGIDLGE
jgi:coiled-coil domain-containing protein 40